MQQGGGGKTLRGGIGRDKMVHFRGMTGDYQLFSKIHGEGPKKTGPSWGKRKTEKTSRLKKN